jgi:hypothetical protein
MKRTLTLAAIIMVATMWALPASLLAQDESGQCYFQATEDIYLKIYKLDKNGVERFRVWEGHLAAGQTKAFNAPYGQVGWATKKEPNDPWDEDQEACQDGMAIEIP